MSKSSSKNIKIEAVDPSKIEVCVDIRGNALRHGLVMRDEFVTIRGRVTSKPYRKILEDYNQGSQVIPPKTPTTRELSKPKDSDTLLLIVGILPVVTQEAPTEKGKERIAPSTIQGDNWYRVAVPYPPMQDGHRKVYGNGAQAKF